MDTVTYPHGGVERRLTQHFVAVRPQIDAEKDLAKKFFVGWTPGFLFLDGQEARLTEVLPHGNSLLLPLRTDCIPLRPKLSSVPRGACVNSEFRVERARIGVDRGLEQGRERLVGPG